MMLGMNLVVSVLIRFLIKSLKFNNQKKKSLSQTLYFN